MPVKIFIMYLCMYIYHSNMFRLCSDCCKYHCLNNGSFCTVVYSSYEECCALYETCVTSVMLLQNRFSNFQMHLHYAMLRRY